jgi:hypothetical protein
MYENITAENWPALVQGVHARMARHIQPYLTPISVSEDLESGHPHGSGSFVEIHGRQYLLTCEHVVRTAYERHLHLGYLLKNDDYYRALSDRWLPETEPVDLAITLIDPAVWAQGDKRALRPGQVATTHDTVPNEAKGYDPSIAFALDYAMELAKPVDGAKGRLPGPIGFSGSPIWDTGFVASGCSSDWTPTRSRVIGVARKWEPLENGSAIIATKAAQVRTFLLDKVRDDVASRHWMERGQPEDDDIDMSYAAKLIPDLS